jgi:hypothetical protein
VHRLWLGGPEPTWLKGFGDSWLQPGWRVVQWTDHVERYERYGRGDNYPVLPVDTLFPLVNQEVYDRASEIAPDHVGQLRSDVLRYEILLRFGGIWVDADFELLRPGRLLELLDGVDCFAAWEEPRRWVGNTIMGATPAHPFIWALVDGLAGNVEKRLGSKPNKLTGPQFVTPTWLRHGEGVTVLDRDLFYPFSYREADEFIPGTFDPAERFPKAVAVHWWHNRRRERGIPCR